MRFDLKPNKVFLFHKRIRCADRFRLIRRNMEKKQLEGLAVSASRLRVSGGCFWCIPLIDVLTYSFEEGYNFASQTYFGTGLYNYHYVLRDPYFFTGAEKYALCWC